jgi:O-antigen/teichoic acid export membrane protein
MILRSRFFANTTYLYVGEVILKASGFLLTVLVARWLGGEELGKWAVAISVMMILGTLLDLGVNMFSVRELTVGGADPSALATWSLILKLWGGVGSLGVLFSLVFFGWVPAEIFGLLTLLFAASLLQAVGSIYATYLRAREEMVYEGILKMFQASFQALVGYCMLRLGFRLIALAWMILFMGVVNLCAYSLLNRKKRFLSFRRPPHFVPNLEALRRCLPFTFLLFFGVIYFRIDMLILRFFWDNRIVGEYAAAYRLLEGVLLLPWAFSSVFYPRLGRVASSSTDLFRDTAELGLKYAFVLGLPIGMLGFYLARPLVISIYGDLYEGSVPAFQILVFTVPVIFLSAVTSTIINVGSSPAVNAWIALIMVVENIGLNLLGIPRWGILAASVATLSTELSGLILGAIYIRQKLFALPFFSLCLRTTAVGFCTWLIVAFFPYIWMVPVYIIFYVSGIWIIGLVQAGDRKFLKGLSEHG